MFTLADCAYQYTHADGLEIQRPAGLSCYLFLFFRSPAQLKTPGGFVQAGGQYILFSPGTPQHYRSTRGPYVNDWVHFEAEDAEHFFADMHIPLNTLCSVTDTSPIDSAISALQALRGGNGPWHPPLCDALLKSLFYTLGQKTLAGGPQNRYLAALSTLRQELYAQPKAGTSVPELAARAGLSESHFQHLYKQLFGCPVGEDIVQGRLHRAQYLLKYSTLPIATVAEDSGYANESHFIRQFRQRQGLTPGQYRRGAAIKGEYR